MKKLLITLLFPLVVNAQDINTGAAAGAAAQVVINNSADSSKMELKRVPDISGVPLTTTLTETCMGSTSIGGVGSFFGFTAGTTWTDMDCVIRLDARDMARELGRKDIAFNLMCLKKHVYKASKGTDKECPYNEEFEKTEYVWEQDGNR